MASDPCSLWVRWRPGHPIGLCLLRAPLAVTSCGLARLPAASQPPPSQWERGSRGQQPITGQGFQAGPGSGRVRGSGVFRQRSA